MVIVIISIIVTVITLQLASWQGKFHLSILWNYNFYSSQTHHVCWKQQVFWRIDLDMQAKSFYDCFITYERYLLNIGATILLYFSDSMDANMDADCCNCWLREKEAPTYQYLKHIVIKTVSFNSLLFTRTIWNTATNKYNSR